MKRFLELSCRISNLLTNFIDWFNPLVLLGIRLYVANIFFTSGWQKITSWESTLLLFQYEYKVPYLSPETAAYLGTTFELVLPILFVLGLGARFPALLLFLFNYVSVISYPLLMEPSYLAALRDHVIWGILLAWVVFHGPDKISLDYLLKRRFCKDYKL